MDELKCCPHCGGAKIRIVTKRSKTGYYGSGAPAYYMTAYATCGQCHARGPIASAKRIPSTLGIDAKTEISALKLKATELWNRRAEKAESERDAAVKDLESLMNEVVAAEACQYCINNGTTKCGIRYTPRAFCDAKWRGADHDE